MIPRFPLDRPTDRTSASILASLRRCWKFRSQAGWPTIGWITSSLLTLYFLSSHASTRFDGPGVVGCLHMGNVVLQRLTSFTGGRTVVRDPSPGDVRLIEGFISHLSMERRLSPHTTAAYRTDLLGLATFLARGGADMLSVDHRLLRRGVAHPPPPRPSPPNNPPQRGGG